MYLAPYSKYGKTHYVIRQSYYDGVCFRHRDLLDLGRHPEAYIVYPGGNAYYIDECIEDALNDQGVSCEGDQLEDIFWWFIEPGIRRVIESFSRNTSHKNRRINHTSQTKGLDAHVFDKRRIHYLRFGRMAQGNIGRLPHQLLTVLENKSRDEIEQYFMESEKILKPMNSRLTYMLFSTFSAILQDIQQQIIPSHWTKRHWMNIFLITYAGCTKMGNSGSGSKNRMN